MLNNNFFKVTLITINTVNNHTDACGKTLTNYCLNMMLMHFQLRSIKKLSIQ